MKIVNKQLSRLLSLIIFLSPSAYAVNTTSTNTNIFEDQKFSVVNNDTVVAVASKSEITRITFESEKIDSIKTVEGEIQYSVDDNDLYLKVNIDKPINFFIKTEKNNIYKFVLTAVDLPAVQLFIKNPNTQLVAISDSIFIPDVIAQELQTRISKAIEIALKPKEYLGFEIKKTSKKIRNTLGLDMEHVADIKGRRLSLQKIVITNSSQQEKVLNHADFMEEQTMVVYLSQQKLGVGQKAYLITVREQK